MTGIAWRAGGAALVFAAAAARAAPPPDPGAAKRPFAIADFYRLTPVLEPAISPDARWLVAAVDVYAECGADAACNKKKDDTRAQGALKAHLADSLLYRHWTQWREGKRSHLLRFDLDGKDSPARDLTPGDFDSPTFEVGGHGGFALSPDGRELAFSSNRDPDPESSTNSDLWVVPVDGGPDALRAPRNITA